MTTTRTPIRRGICKTYTFDPEAIALLAVLAPGERHHGGTLSELIRAEVSRREERRRVYRELAAFGAAAQTQEPG
jgi:hypothetical protein